MWVDVDYDLTGKTVLITGATDGLGRGLAAEAAGAGATVLIHGRDPQRLRATEAQLRDLADAGRLRCYRADFAELAQVRRMAQEINAVEPRLDVLVNNAGIGDDDPGGGRRVLSADGHELRFQVNYLAGYLLTCELLALLRASAPARIVNVSSGGQSALDFDDLMLEYGYSGMRAYCQSKLAQILHAFDLAERLAGTGVTATCLHPATYMPTKMVRRPTSTLQEGVDATLRLVADPALADVSGEFFNGTQRWDADPQAYDPRARRRLRELSDALTQPAADC
jgi:NAD(P)-dependent dehydrogenase (short-subunit alcohol dehydrogenase family)